MVPLSHLVACAALVVAVIAVPGPSVLFTISRALTVGRRTALLTVLGNSAGLCLQVVLAAVGLGALVEESALVYPVVRYAGAAYIIYLGCQALRRRKTLAASLARGVAPVSAQRALRDGFVVGATNPKTIAFLVSALPSFTVPALGHQRLQLLMLGALFPAAAMVLDSSWALLAGSARRWLARSPRRMDVIGGTGGLVMIGIGAGLAATGRKE